ncbi:hypothetical protein V6N11_083929 [Hibiscus sabdariffa]|uniref:Protein FAR1-RELATED SEQUENCE n=1 Tax=Hibiscus sabdariffa TaxID=183260 RepID=A0ABR2QCX0_9ROSI
MMTSSHYNIKEATMLELFFNDESKKKFEEYFIARTFCYEKGFNFKDKPNMGFTEDVASIVKKHKWERFYLHPEEVNTTIFREFYAHLTTKKSSHSSMSEGNLCSLLKATSTIYMGSMMSIRNVLPLPTLSMMPKNMLLDDLYEPRAKWFRSSKNKQMVKRLALKPQPRRLNHFLKAKLMPTTRTQSRDRQCAKLQWDHHSSLLVTLITHETRERGKAKACPSTPTVKVEKVCLSTEMSKDLGAAMAYLYECQNAIQQTLQL